MNIDNMGNMGNVSLWSRSFDTSSPQGAPTPMRPGSGEGVEWGKPTGETNITTSIEVGQSNLDPELREIMFVSKEAFNKEFSEEIQTTYKKYIDQKTTNSGYNASLEAYNTLLEAYAGHPDADLKWIEQEINKKTDRANDGIFESLLQGYLKNPKRNEEIINSFMTNSGRTVSTGEPKGTKPTLIKYTDLVSIGLDSQTIPRIRKLAQVHPDSILGQLMKAS